MRKVYFVSSIKETKTLARKLKNLWQRAKLPNIWLISGELGAGKTTFIRYLLRAFGVKSKVMSPTFILWQTFTSQNFYLHHLDLYRLNSVTDLWKLNLSKKISQPKHLFFIEWGERMIKYLQRRKLPFVHLVIIRLTKKQRLFDLHL